MCFSSDPLNFAFCADSHLILELVCQTEMEVEQILFDCISCLILIHCLCHVFSLAIETRAIV